MVISTKIEHWIFDQEKKKKRLPYSSFHRKITFRHFPLILPDLGKPVMMKMRKPRTKAVSHSLSVSFSPSLLSFVFICIHSVVYIKQVQHSS